MERSLQAIAYGSLILLGFSVVADALDDIALGGQWPGATAILAGLVTASLTALVTYQRQRGGGNGNGKTPAKEG